MATIDIYADITGSSSITAVPSFNFAPTLYTASDLAAKCLEKLILDNIRPVIEYNVGETISYQITSVLNGHPLPFDRLDMPCISFYEILSRQVTFDPQVIELNQDVMIDLYEYTGEFVVDLWAKGIEERRSLKAAFAGVFNKKHQNEPHRSRTKIIDASQFVLPVITGHKIPCRLYLEQPPSDQFENMFETDSTGTRTLECKSSARVTWDTFQLEFTGFTPPYSPTTGQVIKY